MQALAAVRRAQKQRSAAAAAHARSLEAQITSRIRERQDRALQAYARLDKRRGKVEMTDTLLCDLMGMNTQEFYRRLKQYRNDAAADRLAAAIKQDDLDVPAYESPPIAA